MAETDRVKAKDLRAAKGFSLGLTQTNYNAWSAGAMPGGEALSVSVSGTSQPITGNINTDIIFGHDIIRYGCVSSIYAGCFRATSIGDGTRLPTSLTGSTNASVNGYVEYPAGQYVLAPSFTALKGYKDGANYPIGTKKLMTLRGHDGSAYRGASIAIYGTMSTPPIDTSDVFGLGVNKRIGSTVYGTNGRDGPTSSLTYYQAPGSFMEVFCHMRYYHQIANNPIAGAITLSCNKGIFIDNNGNSVGTTTNFGSVRYQPPVLPSGSQTIAVITMTVNLHGFVASETCTVTIVGNGTGTGTSNQGPTNETQAAAHGLIVLTNAGDVRFQADGFDSLARKVSTQRVGRSYTSYSTPSGLQTISAPGCNSTSAFAVCAEDSESSAPLAAGFRDLGPAMEFTSTGTLSVKGAYAYHQATVCRVKGVSQAPNQRSSSYGLEIMNSSGEVILDDGELALGISEKIGFSAAQWTANEYTSSIQINLGKTYSVAPVIAVRTTNNLWLAKPLVGSRLNVAGAYDTVIINAASSERSSGEILVMTADVDGSNIDEYNDDYGLQIFDENQRLVFNSSNAVAAVTDMMDIDNFSTGSSVPANAHNVSSGRSGVTSFSRISTTPNEKLTVGINGNPAADYLCFNGISGSMSYEVPDTRGTLDFWVPFARFRPASQGSAAAVQVTMDYAGTGRIGPGDRHPVGNLLVVRSHY